MTSTTYFNLSDDIHTLNDTAKDNMFAIQPEEKREKAKVIGNENGLMRNYDRGMLTNRMVLYK